MTSEIDKLHQERMSYLARAKEIEKQAENAPIMAEFHKKHLAKARDLQKQISAILAENKQQLKAGKEEGNVRK